MKRTPESRGADYLTDDDRKTLESIFGCMTAVMERNLYKGDKDRIVKLMQRFRRSAGIALFIGDEDKANEPADERSEP